MKMSLRKGRRDFTQSLIQYAIEGNVLSRCEEHLGSIYRSSQDLTPAHEVVEAAWKSGEISSGLDGAIEQLNEIVEKAPKCCSHIKCWFRI